MDEYFGIQRISNSMLGDLLYDPKLFYEYHIKRSREKKTGLGLKLGSAIHLKLDLPNSFWKLYEEVKIPTGKYRPLCDETAKTIRENSGVQFNLALAKACIKLGISDDKAQVLAMKAIEKDPYKTYLTQITTDSNKIPISEGEYDIINQAVHSINNNERMGKIDKFDIDCQVFNELAILWEYKSAITTLEMKSKLDRVIVNHKDKLVTLIDYKSEGKHNIYNYPESFEYWHTYRQMAFYREAIRWWLTQMGYNAEDYHVDCWVFAVETKPPFRSYPFRVSNDYLKKGDNEWKMLCEKYLWHKRTGKWEFHKEFYEDFITLHPTK